MHDTTGTSSQDYAKIRASKGAPGFDVAAALSPPEVDARREGSLLERITEKEVPNIKFTWEKARAALPPVAAMHTLQFDSLLYNKDKIDKPMSWADYWQPEKRYGAKIKGHVINYNPANLLSVYALIHAAELGGGSATNMEPAWAILKAQKPMVGVVVTTSAEAAPHFESGEVWISPYWSARAGYYISRGIPYGMIVPKEGVIANIDSASVPIGAKNKKLAYEFINFHARARDAARVVPRVFLQPRARRHRRLAEGIRRLADRHREAVRLGEAARSRSDRQQPEGLDAEVAGDHGLSGGSRLRAWRRRRASAKPLPTHWLLVAIRRRCCSSSSSCRTRCCCRRAS